MSRLDRHFEYFANVEPRIAEALLVPFNVSGEAVGTIWVIAHDQTRKFDSEDARTITMLGAFAGAVYQALSGTFTLKSVLATIREPLLVLDRNLRVKTASRSFYQTFQVTPAVTEGRLLYEIGDAEWDMPKLRAGLEDILSRESVLEKFQVTANFPLLGRREMTVSTRKLSGQDNPAGLTLLAIEDITNRKRREGDLLLSLHQSPDESQPKTGLLEIGAGIVSATPNFEEIIGSSAALQEVMKQVEMVSPTDATVLILGETGTGKELIARALHRQSSRGSFPFVSLNCAAIPTGLLESELFGYERGAFTGAISQKLGRFELANGGTLFLDEVGDIPLELQPKLLRALQEKSFERLGGTKTIGINVRLIAATNRNLTQMMKDKVFRSDLYYRLMVFPIVTPPLRDIADDIPALVRHFAKKHAAKMDRTITTIPAKTMKALVSWPWPGNVRELENFIERSVILSPGTTLNVPLDELIAPPVETSGGSALEAVARDHIVEVLRNSGGVVSAAATRLGVSRTTLETMTKKLGISRRAP